jgi:diguanylate cyclase (GGDEF)-like protein
VESTSAPIQLSQKSGSKPRRSTSMARAYAAERIHAPSMLPGLSLPELGGISIDLDADFCSPNFDKAFARLLSAHSALQKKMAQLTFVDALTGLKNRAALLISLQRAIDKCHELQSHAAVLMVDIDDFKSHNVHLGHLAGDILLQQVARRIGQTLGPDVAVARLFADKFVVVLEELGPMAEDAGTNAQQTATRICHCLAEAFEANGTSVRLSVSMGLCLIGLQDCISTDVLIDRAELVTDHAKQAGGNCLFSFEFGALEHAT